MSADVVSGYQRTTMVAYVDSGVLVTGSVVHRGRIDTPSARPLSDQTPTPRPRQKELGDFVTTRRFKGFVTDIHGDIWRVVLVDNGKKVAYDLPAEQLRKAGIQARFQPFEMDELESTAPAVSGKVYRFTPLAKVNDAFLDTLPLDSARQKKRARILRKFGKAKS